MGSQNQTLVVVVWPLELRSCSPRLSHSLSCPWPLPRSKLLAAPSGKLTRTQSWPISLPALDPLPPRGSTTPRPSLTLLVRLLVPLQSTTPRPSSTTSRRLSTSLPVEPAESE